MPAIIRMPSSLLNMSIPKARILHLRHAALLNLVRTFTEMGDYDRAEEAFHFLEKEKLNRTNQKKLYPRKGELLSDPKRLR